ncbi:hypothetical protein ACHAW6_005586 [Cyclotella cf. meneghiniana]
MQIWISLVNEASTLQSLTPAQPNPGVAGSFCMPIVWSLVAVASDSVYYRGRTYCPLIGPSQHYTYNGPIRGNEGASFPDHLQTTCI